MDHGHVDRGVGVPVHLEGERGWGRSLEGEGIKEMRIQKRKMLQQRTYMVAAV